MILIWLQTNTLMDWGLLEIIVVFEVDRSSMLFACWCSPHQVWHPHKAIKSVKHLPASHKQESKGTKSRAESVVAHCQVSSTGVEHTRSPEKWAAYI